MKLNGWKMTDSCYRAMLDYIAPKCYVEASSTNQSGTVLKVIYNLNKVPVCLKIESASGKTDYVSVDRVDFWEPFDEYVSDLSEYIDETEIINELISSGYEWDDSRSCYYNEETGDELAW